MCFKEELTILCYVTGSGVGTELKPGWRREAAAHQLIRAGPVSGAVSVYISFSYCTNINILNS